MLCLALVLCLAGCGNDGAAPADGAASKEVAPVNAPDSYRVYVGTYTRPGGPSKGIYLYDFDVKTGALTQVGLAAEANSPSFLALSPDARHLYAVGEMDSFNGKKTGAVGAFAVDPASGTLTPLNQQPSGGGGPCHVSVDAKGKHVFVANYGGGSVASFPVGPDGKLAEAASVVQHQGKGPDARRQEGPHGHWIAPSPDDRFVLACDLGLDQVLVYRLDGATGGLAANDPPTGRVAPGAGPRHGAFSPDGRFLYVINEMGNTMTTFSWDAAKGALTEVQTLGTLPEGYKEPNTTAEVVVHPSGKFVYGSNRGHDSIVAYAADPTTGKLTLVGHVTENIKTPRNINVDPTGRWLIAANQDSDSLVVFKIDPKSGALTQTGEPVSAPMPVCVVFAPGGK
jgi:6-phosphogluconolactonase